VRVVIARSKARERDNMSGGCKAGRLSARKRKPRCSRGFRESGRPGSNRRRPAWEAKEELSRIIARTLRKRRWDKGFGRFRRSRNVPQQPASSRQTRNRSGSHGTGTTRSCANEARRHPLHHVLGSERGHVAQRGADERGKEGVVAGQDQLDECHTPITDRWWRSFQAVMAADSKP